MTSRLAKTGLIATLVLALALLFGACSSDSSSGTSSSGSITVSTNKGDVEVPVNPERVVVLDNTSAETVLAMGVTPVAIPKSLLRGPQFQAWIDNPGIKDIGDHSEPKFEVIEDVEPDLIIAGFRFDSYYDDLKKITDATDGATIDIASGDTALVDGKTKADAMISQTETLGKIFAKEDQAAEIVAQFNTQLDAAKAASNGQTVFLAIVNGGKIDNGAARLEPIITPLDVKDVFAGQAGDHHQNSGLTMEAIAQANPQWVIVMDRDAISGEGDVQPAEAVFAAQRAFDNTEFMRQGHVIYLEPYFYLREGIQSYGEVYQQIADGFGAAG